MEQVRESNGGEDNRKCAAFTGRAVNRHPAAMDQDYVFDNCQSEAGPAEGTAPAFINTVKPLENPC